MAKIDISAISRLKSIVSRIIATQDNESILNMWASIFELNPGEKIKILALYSDVYQMVKNIKEEINAIEGINKSIYLRPIEMIDNGLSSLNFDNQVVFLKNTLGKDNILTTLDYCEDMLSREKGKINVETEEIEKIISDAEELTQEIVGSEELDPILKSILYKNLNNIRDALYYYKINGLEGLEDALKNTAGSFVMNYGTIESNRENEKVKKLFSIINSISSMMSIASTVYTFAPAISKLLSGS